jgi:hypothetical protein
MLNDERIKLQRNCNAILKTFQKVIKACTLARFELMLFCYVGGDHHAARATTVVVA